jgi:hypothetical protein
MAEIRITRSAGSSWPAKFNNQDQPCNGPDCPDKDGAPVAGVAALTGGITGGCLPALNSALPPDAPTDIRVTRSAGQNWSPRFNNQAQPCADPVCPDKGVSTLTGSIAGMGETSPPPIEVPTTINALTDVAVTNPTTGDVLRYANNKWRNYNETQLTDGGNF